MLKQISFPDRESWLSGRQMGIGGSEAAAAVGLSPWMTPLELWKLKLGYSAQKDLSGNAAVQQGIMMEPALRDFFAATHPEYMVQYAQFDILFQAERPYLFATLDGGLIERDTGRRGILEIKTGSPSGKEGWNKWSNGNMPNHYFVQCCHQLLATGYDFVRLFACLYSMNGDKTLKEYEIERSDVEEDLKWLLEQEERFWVKNIQGGQMPSTPLML